VSSWASAHFVGRARELEALDSALEDARRGQARVVLVGAEAGAGKSRLLQEFAGRARSSGIVAEGRCVEQSDGALPYAPIVGVIRQVVRQRGLEHVRSLLDDGSAADLTTLVPALGRVSEREPSRVRLFEGVVTLIDALAAQQPVVLIVEDVHWADAATRDLLLYVASNLEGSGVVLVISHRAVGPSLSVTPFLIALMRLGYAGSIQLAPMSLSETDEQLEAILGKRPAPAVVRAVYERSGGLPIFTEALIRADGTVRDSMPGDLHDLIVAGVRELPRDTQESMRAAAVGGIGVAADLLAAAVGVDGAELARRLRPAVDSGLMIAEDAAYRFRHELVREAVRDGELLPGERAVLHRSYALALESHAEWDPEQGRAARIALHWRGALDHERALRSSWEVACRANASGAYVEELRMLEQTLSVWTRVADPEASIGVDRTEVLEAAVDAACWAAQSERGLALAEAALELLAWDRDGGRRAGMLLQRASLRQQLMLPGYVDDLAEASRLEGVTPEARVEILGQLARAQASAGDQNRAVDVSDELRRTADAIADPAAGLESIATDILVGAGGHEADGVTLLRRVIADATEFRFGWIEALGWMSAVRVAVREGAYRDAIDLGSQAMHRLRDLGLTEYSGAAVSSQWAQAQLELGRRAAALDTIREAMALNPAPNGRAALLLVESEARLGGGELRHSERALADFDALAAGRDPEPSLRRSRLRLQLETARLRGDRDALAASVQAAWLLVGDDGIPSWSLACAALRAVADAPAADTSGRTSVRPAPAATAVEAAYEAWFDAESNRLDGERDAASWLAVAERWAALGRPADECTALIVAATLQDRAIAAATLERASERAAAAESPVLQNEIDDVARRLRIGSPAGDHGRAMPHGLTHREVEVLTLIADGLSNKEIASQLFISPKTASVHVSNILRKLEVPARGAAVAVAYREAIIDAPVGAAAGK
jgi:DNA-binding CsgD family transcriptional regulator/tetratricopeptide (TPR) repeat protein